mmetsp:Transcript_7555/g.17770  ORF Transcript_7555/g.17770 Transcript_7555/m.17770 type:complete len:783 (-) Transcript_7555:148-2496(-)
MEANEETLLHNNTKLRQELFSTQNSERSMISKVVEQMYTLIQASSPSVVNKPQDEWNFSQDRDLNVCPVHPLGGLFSQPGNQAIAPLIEAASKTAVSETAWTHSPKSGCSLLQLEATLLCALFPPERVVMGARVCKTFRQSLLVGPGTVLLKESPNIQDSGDLRSTPVRYKAIEQAQAGLRLFRHWSIELQLIPRANTSLKTNPDRVLKEFSRTGMVEKLTKLEIKRVDLEGTQVMMKTLEPILSMAHNLKHLELSNLRLEFKTSVALGASLGMCLRLEHLDLAASRMCDEGATALGESLKHCVLLRHANLASNRFSGAGAMAVIEGLGECLGLTHLNISDNRNIRNNWHELGTFRGRALADVNFAGCKVGPFLVSQLAGVLAECAELTALNLTNTEMGDEGVQSLVPVLRRCPILKKLSMGSNNLSPDAMRHLQSAAVGQRNLRDEERNLGGSARDVVTVESRDSDTPNAGTNVSVVPVPAGPTGVSILGPQLTEINLYGNFLSEHGARRVGQVLRQCGALQRLVLGCNELGVQGAANLAPYLSTCATLQHLDLYGNRLEDAGFAAIVGAVKRCTALTALRCGGNQIRKPCPLLESASLKVLHLADNGIDFAGALQLEDSIKSGRVPALTALHLGRNEIEDTACESLAKALAKLLNFRLLDLSNNQLLSGVGVRSLGEAILAEGSTLQRTLTHVNLAGNVLCQYHSAKNMCGNEDLGKLLEGLKLCTRMEYVSLKGARINERERGWLRAELGWDSDLQVWQRHAVGQAKRTLEPPPRLGEF